MSAAKHSAAESPSLDAYRELFERSADAILIIEGDRFIDCNAATVKMLRYGSKAELLQTHPSELSPPLQPDGRDSFEKANENMAIALERGSHRFEWDHMRADGEVFPVEVLLTVIQEPGRQVLHVVWRDITERKLLEEELRQALKMEAIGKLTGGIAHDFNNLLVSVLGHADLLGERLSSDPEAFEHVAEIRHAGERAADLVRQLLAFGRKQQLLPVVLDLNALLLHLRSLIARLIGEDVMLVPRLEEGAIRIKADRTQIEQVLLNLAANARDAMPEGGQLTIETSRAHLDHERREHGQGLESGDYAVLCVSDTGTGMSALTAERAFDPFFTTKEAGQGSGLGLATVFGIVTQSGGSVTLHSRIGQGTRVEIWLPMTSEPLPEPAPRREASSQHEGRGETILVVEDEAAVASLVRRALEARGYRVLSSSDGREALAKYRLHHNEIDLLLTDVIMPNMGGPKLVAELEQLGHSPPVLFMSGYTNDGLSALHAEQPGIEALDKPFDVAQLVKRVRAVLDGE